jgi:hypothetical protein
MKCIKKNYDIEILSFKLYFACEVKILGIRCFSDSKEAIAS